MHAAIFKICEVNFLLKLSWLRLTLLSVGELSMADNKENSLLAPVPWGKFTI